VLLELDLDLRAAVGGTESGPSVTRWISGPRSSELLDVPPEQLLVEARELGNVGRIEHWT
jgi:hypothetical protein